jgi:hypothetical protein
MLKSNQTVLNPFRWTLALSFGASMLEVSDCILVGHILSRDMLPFNMFSL